MTVASVLGHLGAANLSAYTASKAALLAYHSSLASELSRYHSQIKTVLVAPGQLDTTLFKDLQVQGFLQNFVGSVCQSHELALKIVRMLEQGKGGEIRTPFYAAAVAWLDVLPHSIRLLLKRWSGLDSVVKVNGSALGRDMTGKNPKKRHATPQTVDDSSNLDESSDDSD